MCLTRLQAASNGAISQQNVDQARADADAAKAKVEELQAALQLSEAGARAEEIAAQGTAQGVGGQSRAVAVSDRSGPASGAGDAVVRSRLREPGDMVTSSSAGFSLALTDPKWVRVW